jgi:hypothetical protein
MVIPGHNSGPAEPLNGIRDSPVVGGDHDPVDQFRLLHPAVNVFYQWLSVDFNNGFSRETSGIVPGGDDCDRGVDLHQNTALDLSMTMQDSAGPLFWQKSCTVFRCCSERIHKKEEPIELHSYGAHKYNVATSEQHSAGTLGDMGE